MSGKTKEIYESLKANGVEFWLNNKQLCYRKSKQKLTVNELAFLKQHKPYIVSLVEQDLCEELMQLNQRWQKALQIESSGAYENKPSSYMERIETELAGISQRAEIIWLTLEQEAPENLNGTYFLEP